MKKWIMVGSLAAIVAVTGMLGLGAFALARGPVWGDSDFGFRGGPPPGQGEFFGRGGPEEGFMGHPGGPGSRRGPGGEVTVIGDNSLTLETPNGDSIVVNATAETEVFLIETNTEGSLSDIQVGDEVGVRGPRNDDGTVTAETIMVTPRGDKAGGRVTAVNGATFTVENPKDGAVTVVTNDKTQFRRGPDGEASLADVTTDEFVMAVGQKQDDGSLAARLVVVGRPAHGLDGPGGPRDGARMGVVSAVEGDSFTLETFWEEEQIKVLTDETTQYRTGDGEESSFEDIAVGIKVMVKGQPVEGQENTIQAEVIGVKK